MSVSRNEVGGVRISAIRAGMKRIALCLAGRRNGGLRVIMLNVKHAVSVRSCALAIFPKSFNYFYKGIAILSFCPFVVACNMVASCFNSILAVGYRFTKSVCINLYFNVFSVAVASDRGFYLFSVYLKGISLCAIAVVKVESESRSFVYRKGQKLCFFGRG